jgi:hypothetical protein
MNGKQADYKETFAANSFFSPIEKIHRINESRYDNEAIKSFA